MTYVLNLLKYAKSSFVIMFICGVHEPLVATEHETLFNIITTYDQRVNHNKGMSRVWTHVAFVRARTLIFTLALNHTDTTDITANTLTYLSANAPLLFKHGYCFSVYVQLPLLYKTHIILFFTKTIKLNINMCYSINKYIIIVNLCFYNIIRCTEM